MWDYLGGRYRAIGLVKGDTRGLDYSSCCGMNVVKVVCCRYKAQSSTYRVATMLLVRGPAFLI